MTDIKNLLIVGDGGCGKSTYVRTVNTGKFKKKYDSTIGYEVHTTELLTTNGTITMKIYDTAGQEKFGSLRDSIYESMDAAFILFDLTSRITYTHVMNWHNDIKRKMGDDFPIVIIGNKSDLKDDRKVNARTITYPKRKGIPYEEISVKDMINLDKPFNHILAKLYNDNVKCVTEIDENDS